MAQRGFDLSILGAELDAARMRRGQNHDSPKGRASPRDPLPMNTKTKTKTGTGTETGTGTRVEVKEVVGSPESARSPLRTMSGKNLSADDVSLNDQAPQVEAPPMTEAADSQPSARNIRREKEDQRENPYPLCLLCLTRPPSAVLLPCCHLNLCYICAPLLIQRHRSALPAAELSTTYSRANAPSISAAPPSHHSVHSSTAIPSSSGSTPQHYGGITTVPLSPPVPAQTHAPVPSPAPAPAPSPATLSGYAKIPYNLLLLRATANHPKSRALAMAGYIPPEMGASGGEMRGEDLVGTSSSSSGVSSGARSTLAYGTGARQDSPMDLDIAIDSDVDVDVHSELNREQGMTNHINSSTHTRRTGSVSGIVEPSQTEREKNMGMRIIQDSKHDVESGGDGKLSLLPLDPCMDRDWDGTHSSARTKSEARCLICRQGVKSWLRVYTG